MTTYTGVVGVDVADALDEAQTQLAIIAALNEAAKRRVAARARADADSIVHRRLKGASASFVIVDEAQRIVGINPA